jgi:hypothetical protein
MISPLTNPANKARPVVVIHAGRRAERPRSDREVWRRSSAHDVGTPRAINGNGGRAFLVAAS